MQDEDYNQQNTAESPRGGMIFAGKPRHGLKKRGEHIAGTIASGIAALVVYLLPSWGIPFLLPAFAAISWAWTVYFGTNAVGHIMLAGYNSPLNATIAKCGERSTGALANFLMFQQFPLDFSLIPGLPAIIPIIIQYLFLAGAIGNGIGAFFSALSLITGRYKRPQLKGKRQKQLDDYTDDEDL